MRVRHLLPDEYSSFFDTELLNFQIQETLATCDSCAMAPPKYSKKDYYRQDLKCCTFQPFLPNYSVGWVLSQSSDQYSEVQSTIRNMIKDRKYALPIGILPSVKYQIEFKKNKTKIFGKSEKFLCPYYSQKRNSCGLWKHRGSVCTSFYCFSSYGKLGMSFWNELQNYLSYTEMLLMEEALIHLDFSPRDVSEQVQYLNREKASINELKSHRMPAQEFKRYWKDRISNPEEFYKKCFQFVEKFPKKDFIESAGQLGLQLKSRMNKSMLKLNKTDKSK